MCVCTVWARHWLSPIPSSVSLTGPSCRAASLFPPDGTTAQLTPPQPCQHNPRLRPTICSPDPDEGRVGSDFKKKDESKDNKEEEKRQEMDSTSYTKHITCRPMGEYVILKSSILVEHSFKAWTHKCWVNISENCFIVHSAGLMFTGSSSLS